VSNKFVNDILTPGLIEKLSLKSISAEVNISKFLREFETPVAPVAILTPNGEPKPNSSVNS
jgi:hypothetical protein